MKIHTWFGMHRVGVIALMTAACGGFVAAEDTTGIPAGAPPQQQKFCQGVLKWNLEFARRKDAQDRETNPIRQAELRKQWGGAEDEAWNELFGLIGPSGEFTGWRGKVSLYDERGGYAVGFNVCAGTINVSLATASVVWPIKGTRTGGHADTLIPRTSPLAQSLGALNLDKDVTVSGAFIWAMPDTQKETMSMNDRIHFLPGRDMLNVDLRGPLLMARFSSFAQR